MAEEIRGYKGIVAGTVFYTFHSLDTVNYSMYWFDSSDNSFTQSAIVISVDDYIIPTNESLWGCAYDDDDKIYFILEKVADNEKYLVYYSITDDNFTYLGIYNVVLMLDRNTASGIQEKAFHVTDDKVFELHEVVPYQLHLISTFNFADVIIGITDSYIICVGGEMYEFAGLSRFVFNFTVYSGSMKIPRAVMTVVDVINIDTGMLVKIRDTLTTAGTTSTELIFEGYVEPFVEQRLQQVALRSPAEELLHIFPEGDYAAGTTITRSDQVISALIGEYCNYVTVGTLSQGIVLTNTHVHFDGDKNLFQILNEFALTDGFIWYLTPTGVLYYNNGTVDSTIDIDETDPMTIVDRHKGPRAVNDVKIKGTLINGVQAQGDGIENAADKQLNGPNPIIRTISHLNSNALCTVAETNILARWGTQATLIEFGHRDTTIGLIQHSETITFQNDKIDPNVGSSQQIIQNVVYDVKNQHVYYTISDQIP